MKTKSGIYLKYLVQSEFEVFERQIHEMTQLHLKQCFIKSTLSSSISRKENIPTQKRTCVSRRCVLKKRLQSVYYFKLFCTLITPKIDPEVTILLKTSRVQ